MICEEFPIPQPANKTTHLNFFGLSICASHVFLVLVLMPAIQLVQASSPTVNSNRRAPTATQSSDESSGLEWCDFPAICLLLPLAPLPMFETESPPLGWPKRDKMSRPADMRLVRDDKPTSEPDISTPGPDFGDLPNSAYTLPQGRSYIEWAPLSYQGQDRQNAASNSGAYLLRYGITDNVELRLGGAGLVSVFDPGKTVTGFAPIVIDTKIHLWNDKIEMLIPAASFEAYIQTDWGSSSLQGGVQPSLNMNLDFPFTEKTCVEMSFGYTEVQEAVNVVTGERFIPRFSHEIPMIDKKTFNVNVFSYQWAIQQQVTDSFQVFLQGYYGGSTFLPNPTAKLIGIGYFYQISKRSMFYNSYNAGLDPNAPSFASQAGFAFAF